MMLPTVRVSQPASPGYFIFPTLSQIIVPTEAARIALQMPHSAAPAIVLRLLGWLCLPTIELRPGRMLLLPAGRDMAKHPALRRACLERKDGAGFIAEVAPDPRGDAAEKRQ
jgi:hypothetical protein